MLFKPIRLIVTIVLLAVLFSVLTACKTQSENQKPTDEPILSTTEATTTAAQSTTSVSASSDGEIPEIDTYIILDDDKTTIHGKGASFTENVLTISEGGAYNLTGSLTDGKIYINTSDETKKVKLVLAGVDISCSSDAPLYVENSPDETVLILKKDTQNVFSDTGRTVSEGVTDYATAAIYSKDDLQIEGSGSLTVNGNFNKGIFSKNDIDIRGGNITVNAVDDGIRGKDSVEIEEGTISITCGGDGIRTSEDLKADKGRIDINGGVINISSSMDAIQATGEITINGGSITAESGGGATESYTTQQNNDRYGRENPFAFTSLRHPDSSIYDNYTVNKSSSKGIKSDKLIKLNNGVFTLNCLDDAIHAPEVIINAGQFTLSSDDDGIHADENLTVNGGKLNIQKSYEGIEGHIITINDGEIIANSSDDGFNAVTSSTSSQNSQQSRFPNKKPGGPAGMLDYDSSCIITVTGGFVLLNARGDGIDSNGSVNMTGGRMVVFGPEDHGNSALDYGGSFTVSGGTLFACGSMGMAQSVTGNGVPVLNFNINGNADTFYALTDSAMQCKIAFTAPRSFQNLVFAGDTLSASEAYSFYSDGTVLSDGNIISGICFNGTYSAGNLLETVR